MGTVQEWGVIGGTLPDRKINSTNPVFVFVYVTGTSANKRSCQYFEDLMPCTFSVTTFWNGMLANVRQHIPRVTQLWSSFLVHLYPPRWCGAFNVGQQLQGTWPGLLWFGSCGEELSMIGNKTTTLTSGSWMSSNLLLSRTITTYQCQFSSLVMAVFNFCHCTVPAYLGFIAFVLLVCTIWDVCYMKREATLAETHDATSRQLSAVSRQILLLF
jgi:hypothetical protein